MNAISQNFPLIILFMSCTFGVFVFLDMMFLVREFSDAALRGDMAMILVFIDVLFNVMVIQPWREKRKSNCGD
ncbi:MAG: hypothetical protein ACI8Q1_003269 [Parvicella sp.]|jgi:hypothetical protein